MRKEERENKRFYNERDAYEPSEAEKDLCDPEKGDEPRPNPDLAQVFVSLDQEPAIEGCASDEFIWDPNSDLGQWIQNVLNY